MSIVFLGDDSMSEPITSIKMYSDGTPMVKTGGWSRIVDRAHTVVVRARDLNEFVVAMFLVDAFQSQSGRWIETLVLPYVPGARQDRVNPTGDVLFTASSVANMINERSFSKVVILDPHSPVITDLIRNVVVYPLSEVAHMLVGIRFRSGEQDWDGVIAADKGGQDRAEQFADTLGLPVFYGGKTRDVSTGRLNGFTLDSIPQGHYLVVDDICDGGGTFMGLADKIREQGSTADLYVTHGIFSKGISGLLEYYNAVYTTDSLAGSERGHYRATVLAVAEEMEK